MKKTIIAALVGGIIMFLWQFISWNVSGLHEPAQQYTPQQDQIMGFLNGLQLKEGGYILPMPPPTASMDEWNKAMEAAAGKPWARVEYHASLQENMTMNMTRGLVTNFITMLLLCWVITRLRQRSFAAILAACLATGFIVFLNVPYTNYIWYHSFDVWGHLVDAVVSWGLVGLWLGWYLKTKGTATNTITSNRRSAVVNID
ncbi:hypothetical protein [Pseudocnuella soli]|uniref:hypothetical protein n=1 Tax=Pseudocnuella soli TaxID=2502779 RepID=UPI001043F07A|nr:hypothetical protein [Pseudocnuella soli]